MSDQTEPEWMKGFVPTPAPQGHRWVKGQSGNPKGRPVGRTDARTKITRALMDDAPAVARVVIDAALEGDLQAASLVLARCSPALRPETYPVQFAFDATAPVARQIEQVLEAMAAGAVSPDVAKQVTVVIGTLSNARAVEELESRIVMLEAKEVR